MIKKFRRALNREVFTPFIDALFDAVQQDQPSVHFIQVGSNDAGEGDVLKDHIRRDKWRGVMIEPVPYIFDRLVEAWAKEDGIVFENVAVSSVSGVFPFYSVKESDDPALPNWYDQIGSFDRDVVLKHAPFIPGLEAMIVELPVSTLTLSEIASKHAMPRIDVLQVDTEGHDLKILQSIDFASFRPALIYFEHKHLSLADQGEALRLLRGNGYAAHMGGADTVAFDLAARERYPRTLRAFESANRFIPRALVGVGKLALHRLFK